MWRFVLHNINQFDATGLFLHPLKISDFLMFSGGTEKERWHEMD